MKNVFKLACPALVAASFAQGAAVSQDDVRYWLSVWQKWEGLEQRNINVRFVHQRELGRSRLGRNIIANVNWWETPGQVNIRFVYPVELETVFGEPPAEARDEAQRAVIHELMHLVTAGLYDDGSGRGYVGLWHSPASDDRMEAINDNLAVMLLRRRAPGGVSVARYIRQQINNGPWNPAPDVKQRVMLQVVRAMNAASEDDVMTLFAQR